MASPSFAANLTAPVNAAAQVPYVEELREFFASHHLPYGAPVDIVKLAEGVAVPGVFHDEMGSMVRSILIREGGNMPRANLLSIVAVAVGGPEMEHAAPKFPEAVLQILSFLGTAQQSRFGIPPEEPETAIAAASSSESTQAEAFPVGGYERVVAPPAIMPYSDVETPSERGFDVFSAGRERFKDSDRTGNLRTFPTALVTPRVSDAPEGENKQRVAAWRWVKRPAVWLSVGCAVLLAGVAAVLLQQRYTSQARWATEHTHAVSPSPIPPVVANIKPSPYGTSLGRGTTGLNGPRTQHAASAGNGASTGAGQAEAVGVRHQDGAELEQARSPETDTAPAPVYRVSPLGPYKSSNPDFNREERALAQPASAASLRPGVGGTTRSIHSAPPSRNAGQRSLSVSSGVMAGNLISAPPPEYPLLARLAHIEGEVILQAVVSKDGSVIATHVLRGHRLLRGAASTAVSHWRYRPYLYNGRPTDVATVVTVEFSRHR